VVERWFASNLHVFVDYFHLIGNIRISFDDDGETARTRSKLINPCGLQGEDGRVHHFETIGAYDDAWACTRTAGGSANAPGITAGSGLTTHRTTCPVLSSRGTPHPFVTARVIPAHC
jgi:hypothetical protein